MATKVLKFDLTNQPVGEPANWTAAKKSIGPLTFPDGDIYIGPGNYAVVHEYRWHNGLTLRVAHNPATPGISSIGVFIDSRTNSAINNELKQADFLKISMLFDRVEGKYNPPVGGAGGSPQTDFKCAVVANAKTGTEYDAPPSLFCRTSAQFIRDGTTAGTMPEFRLNITQGSGTIFPLYVVTTSSDLLNAIDWGSAYPFRTSPPGDPLLLELEMKAPKAGSGGINNSLSRLSQDGSDSVHQDWERVQFVKAWNNPGDSSPLADVLWLGGSIAIADGDLTLEARLLMLKIEYSLP